MDQDNNNDPEEEGDTMNSEEEEEVNKKKLTQEKIQDKEIVQESGSSSCASLDDNEQDSIVFTNNEDGGGAGRGGRKSVRLRSKTTFCQKNQEAAMIKKLVVLLKKPTESLSKEEENKIAQNPRLVKLARNRLEKRLTAIDRVREFEDCQDDLKGKCSMLADIISHAQHLVIYTGAGISTSASIPDYRGPNGIWTLLQKGESLDSEDQKQTLSGAEPTVSHMAIFELYRRGMAKHIVSQNCDGLHLRSGIKKSALSEVHGNMYIEVCTKCSREYVRLFDVTENTRRFSHYSGRQCYYCGTQLRDSIVHFGERGKLSWPLNWSGAQLNADRADVILCLGSSLKVLRRYPWLWSMDRPVNKRPTLCIVNLQWTPKDKFALKIHGKCDQVMTQMMKELGITIPPYQREEDPIFNLATPLHPSEVHTKNSMDLVRPTGLSSSTRTIDLANYIRFEPFIAPEVSKLNAAAAGPTTVTLKKGTGGWLGNAWGVKHLKYKKKSSSSSSSSSHQKIKSEIP